jgi:hypothetical protein
MEYLSFQDVIRSAVSAFAAGVVCGAVGTYFNEILLFFTALIKVPAVVYAACRSGVGFRYTVSSKCGYDNTRCFGVSDLLFTLLFGIVFIINGYVVSDGVFRLYALVLMVVGAQLSRRALALINKRTVCAVFSFAYSVFYKLVFAVIFPFYLLFSRILRAVSKRKEKSSKKVN